MYAKGNCCMKEEERKKEYEEKFSNEKSSTSPVNLKNWMMKRILKFKKYMSKVITGTRKATNTEDVVSDDVVREEPGTLSNMQDIPQGRYSRPVHKRLNILPGELIEDYNDADKKTQKRLEITERKIANRARSPRSYTQSTEKLMDGSVTPCNEGMQNDDRHAQNINLKYQTTEHKSTQTDFRAETWILRKTTIRHGSDFINVVSAIDGDILPPSNIMEIRDDVTAVKQLSEVRLFILRNARAGKIGFLDLVVEKLKTESQSSYLPEDENTNNNYFVILSLCSELLDLLTTQFEEYVGPFPLEQRFFNYVVPKLLFIFVTLTIQNKLSDKMDESRNCNCNVDYSRKDLETAPYDHNEKVTSLDREQIVLTEGTRYLTNIPKHDQLNLNNNFKYQQYLTRKFELTGGDKCEEQCITVGHELDLTGGNVHGDRAKPNLQDIGAKQLQNKRSKENIFHIDFNPVGAFERGTQYRTDGEVVIEKCKRGLIISEKRTKVKTRGLPNKHLCRVSSLMSVNVGEDIEIDKSRRISDIHETHKMDECVENLNKTAESRQYNSNGDCSRENLEIVLYDPIELTKDTRHLMNMPIQIIQGKKNDCELLEEKYAPKNNKKRQKDNKKKRHRSKFVHSNVQCGLNSNNSADDPNMWSTDEEDDVNCSPTIMYSSQPLMEEYVGNYISPTISFSTDTMNNLNDHNTCNL